MAKSMRYGAGKYQPIFWLSDLEQMLNLLQPKIVLAQQIFTYTANAVSVSTCPLPQNIWVVYEVFDK